ncbi:MAG: aminoglycoside phosphotransferase family protein [Proteobacteria bacterium]|nr:aminoglycoside phosphotransferase family protein [Pseudomonadota bacterium]
MLSFLRSCGLAGPAETPAAEPLTGGVSSDIWKVALASGTICVKRALPRLRVAQVWEAPVGRNRYERLWMGTATGLVPGIAPRVLAWDEAGYFAMEYLDPVSHPLWKAELAAGRADAAFAARVGRALARIHAGTANSVEIATQFRTDASFHALRLEPYLLATGRAHPALAARLDELAAITANTRIALVHGDVSPKNILLGPAGPVVLDAECAWYGDPAFDIAFCLNHLLLKCLWVPAARAGFLACFDAFSDTYLSGVDWEPRGKIEARAAALLPGLLLARVDGKSPAEYLTTDQQKDTVRRAATALLQRPVERLAAVRNAWEKELSK